MNKLMAVLKKYWIGLSVFVVVAAASIGWAVYVNADTSFAFVIHLPNGNFTNAMNDIYAQVKDYTGLPDGYDFNQEKVSWEAIDELIYPPVFRIEETSRGDTVKLVALGAGVSKLTASYNDTYTYTDEGGNEVSEVVSATASSSLKVTVPLNLSAVFSDGDTIFDTTTDDKSFVINYNGYIYTYEVDGRTYASTQYHPVVFSYNPNVLTHVEDVTTTSTKSTFTVIGAGQTKVSATVDSEVSASIPETIYVGVKFDSDIANDGLLIKQDEVYTLSEDDTNILNSNFGYVDASGSYSVYFWTYEDYQREILKAKDVVDVIDVSNSGVVTGMYRGITTLYASCRPLKESYDASGNLLTEYADSIQVEVPLQSYFESDIIVGVGDDIPIKTSAFPSNVTYQMFNNEGVIAQTNENGVFKAIAAGTAEVYVFVGYYDDGVKVEEPNPLICKITVIDKLTVSTDSVSLNSGSSVTVTAIPTCTDPLIGSKITWTSANPEIAEVTWDDTSLDSSLTATITGITKGNTTITCTQIVDGIVKIATIKVTVTVPVDGITLSEPQQGRDYLTMQLGETITMYAYLQYSNNDVPDNTELIWTVSGDQLLTLTPVVTEGVTQSCTVTANQLGQTTITVYSADSNQIVTCDVLVTEAPTSITLSDTSVLTYMSLKQYQMQATVESPTGGADQTVIWTSLDESVCKIDPNTGLVTFVAPGTTYIYATSAVDPGVSAYCYFEIAQDVYGIVLDKKELTLSVGDTYRLTATVSPADAYDKSMVWTSSNPKVVAVENSNTFENLLTATGSGSATIFVETNDGGYIAFCNITVLQPVTSIEISQTEMTVRKGTEFYLNAVAYPENAEDRSIEWSTNDKTIATVSSDGKVTTVSVGQCIITATNKKSGISVSCVVNVLEPITGMTLNTYYQNMVKGTRFVLIPTIEPITASNKSVTYWSSDENVATVDEKGVVIAVNGGVCEIVVTTVEGQLTQKCTIVVKEYVSTITLSDEFRYVNIGDTYTISAEVGAETATDKSVIWTSSNNDVATINQFGVISGVGYGNTVITATAADGSGVSASCIIQVIEPVTSIVLDKSKVTMYVGDVIHINATVLPDNATVKTINWTSSDPSIAKVYDDGDVEAVSVGRCKIYATSMDGNDIVAECTIIVKNLIEATSISINSDEIIMLTGKTRKLTAQLYPLNSNESVKWESTDTSVVVVDENGQITTVGPGSCEVVAYTSFGTVQDRCIVHSIAMNENSITIEQYDTFNLYVDGAPDTISWRTSNPRIATVTQGGLVTGRMPGECSITGTIDGKTVTCFIKVMAIDPGKFINSTTEEMLKKD